PDLTAHAVELTRIVGDRLVIRYADRGNGLTLPEFDRQARVFGARTTEDLQKLRVGIVGCGGTGSAVASLLARIGVTRFGLIDVDHVDTTNLNRLVFSTRADAISRRSKIDVVAEAIAEIGLAEGVVRLKHYV